MHFPKPVIINRLVLVSVPVPVLYFAISRCLCGFSGVYSHSRFSVLYDLCREKNACGAQSLFCKQLSPGPTGNILSDVHYYSAAIFVKLPEQHLSQAHCVCLSLFLSPHIPHFLSLSLALLDATRTSISLTTIYAGDTLFLHKHEQMGDGGFRLGQCFVMVKGNERTNNSANHRLVFLPPPSSTIFWRLREKKVTGV